MKLGIYSGADPRLSSTWSGTPANLIGAFEELGIPMSFYHPNPSEKRSLLGGTLEKLSSASALFSKTGIRHHVDGLIRNFSKENCDAVLHISGEHLPYLGCKTRVRHLVFIDSTFEQFLVPWFDERYKGSARSVRILLSLEMKRRNGYYRKSLANIDHFFVTTDWVRNSLIGSYGIKADRITTCYTGRGKISNIPVERDHSRPKILFVARHNYINKGASLLLDAFRLIKGKHKHAELVIVGPNREDLAIPDNEVNVVVHGFLEWSELEELFNTSTLFAMPSLYEPYGLVYLEAMGCGTPVICSSNGGMASIVREQDCGWALDKRDPVSLSMILDAALSDPEVCMMKGMNGQKFVESKCSWTRCATIIRDYLELPRG